ncbi:hypothetical protein V1515DRAFT_589078 [Lipomyces mesembrius]
MSPNPNPRRIGRDTKISSKIRTTTYSRILPRISVRTKNTAHAGSALIWSATVGSDVPLAAGPGVLSTGRTNSASDVSISIPLTTASSSSEDPRLANSCEIWSSRVGFGGSTSTSVASSGMRDRSASDICKICSFRLDRAIMYRSSRGVCRQCTGCVDSGDGCGNSCAGGRDGGKLCDENCGDEWIRCSGRPPDDGIRTSGAILILPCPRGGAMEYELDGEEVAEAEEEREVEDESSCILGRPRFL